MKNFLLMLSLLISPQLFANEEPIQDAKTCEKRWVEVEMNSKSFFAGKCYCQRTNGDTRPFVTEYDKKCACSGRGDLFISGSVCLVGFGVLAYYLTDLFPAQIPVLHRAGAAA